MKYRKISEIPGRGVLGRVVCASLLGAGITAGSTFNVVEASTTPTSLDTVVSQLVNVSTAANSILGSGSVLDTEISLSSSDWNQIFYGTTSPTTVQLQSVSLLQMLEMVAEFRTTDQATANSLVQYITVRMQVLNSAISAPDVYGFLSTLEAESLQSLSRYARMDTVASADVIQALQSAATTAEGTSTSIRSLFAVTSVTVPQPPAPPSPPPIPPQFPGAGGITPPTSDTGGAGGDGGTTGGSGGSTGTGGGGFVPPVQPGSGAVPPTGDGGPLKPNGAIGAYGKPLTSISIGKSGGAIDSSLGTASIHLLIPPSAFEAAQNVAVVTVDVGNVQKAVPAGYQALTTLGVHWTGPAPAIPVILTVDNPAIPADAQVFKVTGDTWVPVPAIVSAGKVVITFSSDPDFIIVSKSDTTGLRPNQRGIYINGKRNAAVPGIVQNDTTYMPIWYVMNALKSAGFTSTWDGTHWKFTTPQGVKTDLSNVHSGHGKMQILLNGVLVQNINGVTAKDPSTGNLTTYMPVWYVMQMLKRAGVDNAWDGTHWYLVAGQQ